MHDVVRMSPEELACATGEADETGACSARTELRLYDVAKGSLEELAGDYEAYLVGRGVMPWAA